MFRLGDIDTFIIGAQKAGTTSLHHMLCQHSMISGPIRSYKKEMQFWNPDGPGHRTLFGYRVAFPLWKKKGERFLDSTPNYCSSPDTIRRIVKYNPSAKFIYILRNPVHRFISAYNMVAQTFNKDTNWRGRKVFEPRSLSDVFEDEIAAFKNGRNTEFKYLASGHYSQIIKSELVHIPQDQLKILVFELDLLGENSMFSEEIQSFLSIPFEPITMDKLNANKKPLAIPPNIYRHLHEHYTEQNKDLESLCNLKLDCWNAADSYSLDIRNSK